MSYRALKALLLLEVVVCFGPIAVLLVVGTFFLPVWLIGVVSHFNGTAVLANGEEVLLPIWAMVVVLGGILGFFGLFRVINLVLGEAQNAKALRRTEIFTAAGIAAFCLFHLWMVAAPLFFGDGIRELWELLPQALIFFLLPGLASAHILYLARNSLFRRNRA